jgi:hypothetical protein
MELAFDAFDTLHEIFKLGYKWDIEYWHQTNGDVTFRAQRKKLDPSKMNVHYEIVASSQRHNENYVAQKLELFRRRLAA